MRRVASLDSQPQLELIANGRHDEDEEGDEPGLNGTDNSSSWSWLRSVWARMSPYSRPSEQGTPSMTSLAANVVSPCSVCRIRTTELKRTRSLPSLRFSFHLCSLTRHLDRQDGEAARPWPDESKLSWVCSISHLLVAH